MKTYCINHRQQKLIFMLFFCFSFVVLSQVTYAQKIRSANGQPIMARFYIGPVDSTGLTEIITTLKSVYITILSSDARKKREIVFRYAVTGDRTIRTAFMKDVNLPGEFKKEVLYVLLSDGAIITVEPQFGNKNFNGGYKGSTVKYYSKSQQLLGKDPVIDANGDDLYAITTNACYISRDSGETWDYDTVGLGSNRLYKLSLDSNQRVYLATSKGLFTQELISNQWIKNTTFPEANCSFVYIDRRQIIYAFGGNKLYVSADFGKTFLNVITGMPPGVVSMTDDAFGNIYAIAGTKILMSKGGISPLEEIQQGIELQLAEPITPEMLTHISGDSSINVSSKVGLFTSYDQGKTWAYFSVEAESSYGLTKTNTGNLIASTTAGIFKNTTDTTWTKVFPSTTYGKFDKIFKDKNGVLYTTSQSNKLIWKSSDNAATWSLDTAGYSTLRGTPFSVYVDDEGTMHAYVNGTPSLVYSRTSGNSWQLDTLGFRAASNSLCTSWGMDKDGYIYLATTSNYLQKRLKTGGAWITDTAGLLNNATIYDMAVEPNGTLWAGTYIGAFKRINGRWTQLAYPVGVNSSFTNSCFVLSVDKAGAVWTQWTIFTTKGNAIGTGVYYTLDGGNTWTTMKTDSVTFRQLISIDDTTYGVSYVDGLYKFTRNPPTGVEKLIELSDNQLLLFPNPTQQSLEIDVKLGKRGLISIFDERGSTVATHFTEATNRVRIDVSGLPKGWYQVKIGNMTGQFIKE